MLEGHTIMTFPSDIKSLEILDLKFHGQVDVELGTVMASSNLQ